MNKIYLTSINFFLITDPFLNSINSDLKVEITPKMSKLVLLHRKLPDLRQKTSQILFVLHTVIVEKLGKLDENSIDMKLRDFLPFVLGKKHAFKNMPSSHLLLGSTRSNVTQIVQFKGIFICTKVID